MNQQEVEIKIDDLYKKLQTTKNKEEFIEEFSKYLERLSMNKDT